MMHQTDIWDILAGREARDAGIALVEEHKGPDVERVRAIILTLAARGTPFTSDDLWLHIDWPCAPAVVGAAFNALARRREIVKTGTFTQSKRPNQHATTIFYWQRAQEAA